MMGLNLEEEFRKAMMQMAGGSTLMIGERNYPMAVSDVGMMGGNNGMMGGDVGMIGINGSMMGGNNGLVGGRNSMMDRNNGITVRNNGMMGGNSDMRSGNGDMMGGGGRLSSGRQERPVLLPGNNPVAIVKKPELCPLWLDEGRYVNYY